MNYKSVHDYIKDTATGLGFDVSFFHGRVASAQQIPVTKSVNVWLLPMTSNGSFYADSNGISEAYTIQILIYMQDRADSGINRNKTTNADYQREADILGQTSTVANELIRKLSDNNVNNDLQRASDLLTISSFSKEVAIKDTSKYLTGTVLNLTINVPDNFDYCC